MVVTSNIAEQLIDSALKLTEERGWRGLTLPDVAAEAGVSLPDAYSAFPTKMALLNGFLARIDRQMLSGEMPDPTDTVRDRLFDVVMRRFDALEPHKNAIAVIIDDLPGDPLSALALLPAFGASMAWMLESAGLSASGVWGALRIKGLAVIYLTTLRTWLQDDTVDAARTMAALDRALRRTEMLIQAFPGLSSRRRPWRDRASSSTASASGSIRGEGLGEVPPEGALRSDTPS